MKQLKDRIISAAILFSVILTGVCIVWWGYAPVYQKSLGTGVLSPSLHQPSLSLILILLIVGMIAVILGCLFRKKLPFFQPRTAVAVILTTLVLIRAMEWANESNFPSILAFLSPLSMRYLYISQIRTHWTNVLLSFILTCMLCGILLFVLLVRKQVHWPWTTLRIPVLANVFAIGTIHGGLRSLYPYVLEILIWLSIGEQGIQALQKWINQGKGGS